jgi:hypothetical protein
MWLEVSEMGPPPAANITQYADRHDKLILINAIAEFAIWQRFMNVVMGQKQVDFACNILHDAIPIFYNDLICYITISKHDTFLIWTCSNCNHSQTRSESCNATYCVSLDCILRSVTEIVCKWTNIIIIECWVFYAYATLMFVQGLNDHSFIMVEPRFCSV